MVLGVFYMLRLRPFRFVDDTDPVYQQPAAAASADRVEAAAAHQRGFDTIVVERQIPMML